MYTLIIALCSAVTVASFVWSQTQNMLLVTLAMFVVVLTINIVVSRHFLKKIKELMALVEKDVKAERYDMAIDRLKSGQKYAKWQFLIRQNLNSHIGTLYYIRKKFSDALPYLKDSTKANWTALSMLAAYYFKQKEYAEVDKVMKKAIKKHKKEPFVYSLYAYFLNEQKRVDETITVLTNGVEKLPLDKNLSNELDAAKNKKKIKIQNYGPIWLQLHLDKMPEGGKQYQSFLVNQRGMRRR